MGFSFSRASINSNVIHVDGYTPSINEVPEDGVHHGLEGGWQVGESKEHHSGLKEFFIHYEGCFPSILLFNKDFIVSPFNVESSEHGSSSQVVN